MQGRGAVVMQAEALGIPGLRFWPLRRYPMHLFYNDGAMPLLLLLRVLHERMKVQRSTLTT